jgi:hypothetical protein
MIAARFEHAHQKGTPPLHTNSKRSAPRSQVTKTTSSPTAGSRITRSDRKTSRVPIESSSAENQIGSVRAAICFVFVRPSSAFAFGIATGAVFSVLGIAELSRIRMNNFDTSLHATIIF